ncbi:MAG: hypothetical protein RXR03_08280 [Thermocladium sp.]
MPKKIIIRNHTLYVVEEGRERPVVRLLGEVLGFYAFDILDEEYMYLDYLALHNDGEIIINDELRRD